MARPEDNTGREVAPNDVAPEPKRPQSAYQKPTLSWLGRIQPTLGGTSTGPGQPPPPPGGDVDPSF